MRFIAKTTILVLLTGLCFQSRIFAQENVSMEDKIIGSTFKTLAKAFVAMTDINKLKKDNIDILNKMEEAKFRTRYAKVYGVIKDLPPKLKASFRVTEHMAKEQAVKNIESLDKKRIYETIDSIPDTIIAKQFKRYLSEKQQEMQKSNIVKQVNNLWVKMTAKVNYPKNPR